MPLVPFFTVTALGGVLAGMLAFMLGRRAWRAVGFRRRDRYREYWVRRLPVLLAWETPRSQELREPESREMLESLLISRLETAEPGEHEQLLALIERAGLLGERIRRARRGPRWERLDSVALLGRMHAPGAVSALVQALEDPWPPIAAAALRSLAMIASPAAGPAIVRFLERGRPVEPNLWLEAAVACVSHPEEFLRLIQDEREEVRVLAARALAESPHRASFDSLHPLAFHPDPEVRSQVARVLGRNEDDRAVSLLIAATQDEVWFVRLRAVTALGESGAVSSLNAVLRAAKDTNFLVRQGATAALARLISSPGKALEVLMSGNDSYAVEGFLSQLARAGLLWRSLPLLRSPDERARRDAQKLVQGALAAGYYPVFLSAVETHPEWRVRMAVARMLAGAEHPGLAAALEQGAAAASTPRLRRLLRAILRCQPSYWGDQARGPVAHPA